MDKDAIIDALCEETDLRLAQFMQEGTATSIVDMGCRYIQFANDFPDDFQDLIRKFRSTDAGKYVLKSYENP